MKLKDLADRLGLPVHGVQDTEVMGMAKPTEAGSGDLVFLEKLPETIPSSAAAFLLPKTAEASLETLKRQNPKAGFLFADKPREIFRRCLEIFDPYRVEHGEEKLSPVPANIRHGAAFRVGRNVIIEDNAVFGDSVTLMGNNFIGKDVRIGSRVVLHPGVVIEAGCVLGDDVIIHANSVIGSDGFGYEASPRGAVKIPQIGNVVIGNHVEIGSNTSIDRSTLGSTRIGHHVKIDNLVQIAHNVEVGDGTLLAGQVGIAGSTRVGRGVIMAGQVGVSDHCVIEDGVTIGAKSAVYSNKVVTANQVVTGIPVQPLREHLKTIVYLGRLAELFKKKKEE